MLNIKRVDVRKEIHEENSIYIGRYNKAYNLSPSPLANPFIIGKDGNRDEVVEKYRQWLWVNVKRKLDNSSDAKQDNSVFTELKRLQLKARKIQVTDSTNGYLTLMCWCKENKKCHGDIIISCLNWMETNHIGD